MAAHKTKTTIVPPDAMCDLVLYYFGCLA